MSTLTTIRVWAKLWNDKQNYNVELNLEVRELDGQGPFPDARAVAQISLARGSAVVEDGLYNLEYVFDGRQEKTVVRVIGGILMSKDAA